MALYAQQLEGEEGPRHSAVISEWGLHQADRKLNSYKNQRVRPGERGGMTNARRNRRTDIETCKGRDEQTDKHRRR